MNFSIVFVLWAFILVLSFGSSNTSETTNSRLEKILSGFNQFSIDFYKTVVKSTPGNFVSSGISAYTLLLFMTYYTDGETQQQLENALRVSIDHEVDAILYFNQFIEKMRNDSNVELFFANALFTQSSSPTKVTFDQLYVKMIGINLENNDEAVGIINNWSQRQTNNKIPNLIESADLQDNDLVMATTAFFKGTWQYPFKHFQNTNFYNSKNDFIPLKMMCNTEDKYNYGLVPYMAAQYVELPYQTNDSNNGFSMYIILPHESTNINTITRKLHNIDFTNLESAKRNLTLCMPKFKIVKKLHLTPTLKKMGIVNLFENFGKFAFFSNNENPKITTLIQKTVIMANEYGTEPSAIVNSTILQGPIDKSTMYINRPFIAAIVSKMSGSPLFVARVKYPPPQLQQSEHPEVILVPF